MPRSACSRRAQGFHWHGERYVTQDPGRGGGYSHTQLPNRKSCFYSDLRARTTPTETMIAAASYHPGGVNVLFGDGSVRFVKSSVGYHIWYALGTRCRRRDHQLRQLLTAKADEGRSRVQFVR